MNLKKVVLFFVLADFTAYSVWVAANGGSVGEVLSLFSVNPWIGQVTLDLVIALSMVLVWIWNDAKANGRNPIPWVIATLCTGSIATLAYFAFRPSTDTAPTWDGRSAAVSQRT
jgi:hypothetical protein